ncbi:MAG: hypothetical protein ABIR70_19155 [Bryobacteraceae bacterium]
MPTEKELDKALETALKSNELFREWFISRTKFKGDNPEYLWSRSDSPWTTVQLALPSDKTGEFEIMKRQGETDVLFVFQFPAEPMRRCGLHIENKLASGRFTKYQPQLYAARAKQWANNPKYGNYNEWDTVLVAPQSFLDGHYTLAKPFGAFVSHEEIAHYITNFGRE